MADAPLLSADGAARARRSSWTTPPSAPASPVRSCTRACAPSRPRAGAAPPPPRRAGWSPAAARSPGARRARAAPAPAPTARRSGPAEAPCSVPSRAPTPSRSTARSSAPRCAARSRCTPSAARSRSSTRGVQRAEDPPGARPARGLGPETRRAPTLVVLAPEESSAALSFRNLARVAVLDARERRRHRPAGRGVAVDLPGAPSTRSPRAPQSRRGERGESA